MESKNQNQYEDAYKAAVQQIEQEWRHAGMSQEELEQSKRVADTLDTLAAYGVALDCVPESSTSPTSETLASIKARIPALAHAKPAHDCDKENTE